MYVIINNKMIVNSAVNSIKAIPSRLYKNAQIADKIITIIKKKNLFRKELERKLISTRINNKENKKIRLVLKKYKLKKKFFNNNYMSTTKN